MPACVAYWNPRSLNASSTCEIADAPYACTSASIELRRVALAHRLVDEDVLVEGSKSSPIVSSSARSILSL